MEQLLAESITQFVLTASVVLVGVVMVCILAILAFLVIYMAIEKMAKEIAHFLKRSKQA